MKIKNQFGKFLLCTAIVTLTAGCGEKKEEFKEQDPNKKKVAAAHTDHVHGPHDGHLAELGDGKESGIIVEVTYSDDPREVAIYFMDYTDKTKAKPIAAKTIEFEIHDEKGGHQELDLSAEPQEGETDMVSKFVVTGAAVPEFVKDIEDIEGHLHVEIDGKTLEANFGHDEDEH